MDLGQYNEQPTTPRAGSSPALTPVPLTDQDAEILEPDTPAPWASIDPSLGLGVEEEPASAPQRADAASVPAARPSWIHLVAAIVGGLVLVMVPVGLWVGPSLVASVKASTAGTEEPPDQEPPGTGPGASAAGKPATGQAPGEEASANEDLDTEKLEVGKVWISKCEKPGPGRTPPDQCDRQPWFEQSLVRAIKESASCAPSGPSGATISVVMRVDYRKQTVDTIAGKSGSIRGRAAKGFLKCVERALPQPDWNSLGHEHTKYLIAVMVTVGG